METEIWALEAYEKMVSGKEKEIDCGVMKKMGAKEVLDGLHSLENELGPGEIIISNCNELSRLVLKSNRMMDAGNK